MLESPIKSSLPTTTSTDFPLLVKPECRTWDFGEATQRHRLKMAHAGSFLAEGGGWWMPSKAAQGLGAAPTTSSRKRIRPEQRSYQGLRSSTPPLTEGSEGLPKADEPFSWFCKERYSLRPKLSKLLSLT
jgi:hypothetical protein